VSALSGDAARVPDSGSALVRALLRHASERPDARALSQVGSRAEPETLSWRELELCAARIAERVNAAGCAPHTLLLVARNSIETQCALLGCLGVGANVLPVSPLATASELRDLAARAKITLAIADAASVAKLEPLGIPVLPLERARDGDRPRTSLEPRGRSLLLQSSGTTGLPKIVQREAHALAATGTALASALGLGPEDRLLLTLPQYHSYGIDTGLLAAVVAGCEVEIHETFVPARVRSAVLERGVTLWPAVPLMLDLVSRLGWPERPAHALRHAVSAGSPLPARVAEQFHAHVQRRVGQIYGASEFGSVTFGDAQAPDHAPTSVGRPLCGVAIQVRSRGAAGRVLAPGREGEVWISAASMMSRYLDDATRPGADGFLRTGDLGALDERGVLTLTGRSKLLIDVGGQSINPLELEACLNLHPAVRESVVIATRHSDTSERLKAIIVPEPGARPDPAEILRHARLHLARSKVPRSIEIREDVPRTPTGKIHRRELQRLERDEREGHGLVSTRRARAGERPGQLQGGEPRATDRG